MARFTETVNIQPQTFSTGQPELLMSLSDKLGAFAAQQTNKRAEKVIADATLQGQTAGIEQQQAGGALELKEEKFIGGVSAKAFNTAAREGYIKSLDNDVMESFTNLAAENSQDLQSYNTGAEALAKGFMAGVDPASRPAVELSIDSMISRQRPRIQAAQAQAIVDQGNQDQAVNATERSREAWSASFDGDMENAGTSLAVAIDSISNRSDLSDSQKATQIRDVQLEERESFNSGVLSRTFDAEGSQAALDQLNEMSGNRPGGFTPDEWDSFIAGEQTKINRKISRQKAQASIDVNAGAAKLRQYKTAKSLGFEVSPQDEAQLNSLIAGTDLQKAKKIIDDTAQFSVMSSSDRSAVLSQAQTGQLDDVEMFGSILKADQEINKLALADGYGLGVKQGIVDELPLDIGSPESFQARLDQSEILSAHYGVDVSPLSSSEAQGIADSIPNMTTDEKIALATTFQAAPAVWGQLDSNNAGQFAMAGATGDFTVMSAIFKGQELLAEKLVKTPSQTDYLSDFNDLVEGVYEPQDRKAILDAVISHYSSSSSSAIDGSYDGGDFEASVMAVTGGITKINGFKLELPRGVDEDDFEDFVDDLQPETISSWGGVANYTDEEAAEAIKQGRIRSIGANQYMVETNGGTLFGNDGEPFIFGYSLDTATTNTALSHSRAITRRREARAR